MILKSQFAASRLVSAALIILALFSAGCMRAKLANPLNALQPNITTVIPNVGAYTRNTQVAVIGTGFMDGASLMVGDRECLEPRFVSETTMLCTAQPQNIGRADVKLINPNDKVARLENAFAFVDSVTPVSGYALNSGGGISTSPSAVLHSSIGETGAPVIQRSANHLAITGIQAITSK